MLRERNSNFNTRLHAENIELKTEELSKKAEHMTERLLTIEQTITDGLNQQHQRIQEKLKERSRNSFHRSMSTSGSLLAGQSRANLASKAVFPAGTSGLSSGQLAGYTSNILDGLGSPCPATRYKPSPRDL